MNTNFHTHSRNPVAIIESLSRRPDQPASMRQYMPGFDSWLDMLQILTPDDPDLELKTRVNGAVMKEMALDLSINAPWIHIPEFDGQFSRHILAVEEPTYNHMDEELAALFTLDKYQTPDRLTEAERFRRNIVPFKTIEREGSELLVAHWGKGFSSPVHGHAPGLLHEEILFGEILVNTYRWDRPGIVRPVRSDIAKAGTLVSQYSAPDARGGRMGLIHNFIAAKPSASLHFVPEHTRDGRDNQYNVEGFHLLESDVEQITTDRALRLHPGYVALVRSANVPQYGDHFIVITGAPEVKEHGIRPADVAIHAPHMKQLLDEYEPQIGVIILLLKPDVTKEFLEFHHITVDGNKITFPTA